MKSRSRASGAKQNDAMRRAAVMRGFDVRRPWRTPCGRAARVQFCSRQNCLTAVQKVTDAAVRNDAGAIVAAAKPMGMAAAGGVQPTLAAKLPLEFKQLGHSVHQDFDRIALDAEAMGDTRHALAQLGETLGKCVACHAMYQITAPASR